MSQIGEYLLNSRLEKGASIADVERATKIPAKYIKAIEEDNYGVLPGRAYIIGFLTSYANFLGLDAKALVNIFKHTYPDPEAVQRQKKREGEPPGDGKDAKREFWGNSQRPLKGIIVTLLIFLLLVGGGITILVLNGRESDPVMCTVTFDAGSGSVSPGSQEVEAGETIKLPTPSRQNYTFDGWFTAASGGELVGLAGVDVKIETDVKFYAQWTRIVYTISFNPMEGEVTPLSLQVGAGLPLELPTPVREDYEFVGWYTSASGGSLVTSGTTASDYGTLFARWTLTTPTYGALEIRILAKAAVWTTVRLDGSASTLVPGAPDGMKAGDEVTYEAAKMIRVTFADATRVQVWVNGELQTFTNDTLPDIFFFYLVDGEVRISRGVPNEKDENGDTINNEHINDPRDPLTGDPEFELHPDYVSP
ncbi:MAG: InlB B-repeat-containing protein [Clostridiales bacterium]|nr:InlB B-repeat-containing protein [Clostridiales bacterium]